MAAYLARAAPASLKWAVAGRSQSKLEALRATLNPQAKIDILLAQVDAPDTLLSLARRCRLVLSAAGPYSMLGEPVVAACIEAKAHYVDITGEVPWVAAMRHKYGSAAERASVCLCSFSGYDCVPAELSVFVARKQLNDERLQTAECVFELDGGGAPRGTLLTVLNLVSASPQFAVGVMSFLPAAERLPTFLSLLRWLMPWWSAHVGAFTVPHFMGWCNTPVVHASCAALGSGGIRYQDRQILSRSPLSLYGLIPLVLLYAMAPLLLLGVPLILLPPVRMHTCTSAYTCTTVAARRASHPHAAGAPAPSYYHMHTCTCAYTCMCTHACMQVRRRLIGLLESSYSYKGSLETYTKVHTRVKTATAAATATFVCPGDAGIHCTGLLAVETALAMLEADTLPAGLMTPAIAVGDGLAARLRTAGVVLTSRREHA